MVGPTPALTHLPPTVASCCYGRPRLTLCTPSVVATPGSQPQYSPCILLLKPKLQHPAPLPTLVDMHLMLGNVGWQYRPSVQVSLHCACRNLVAALSSEALKLPLWSDWSLCWWGSFPGCRNLSSFTVSSQECRSWPSSFLSLFFFFFFPTRLCGDFLALSEVWDCLPAFNRYSVRIIPRVDVCLMYLWEEVSSLSYYSAILITPTESCFTLE